MPETVLDDSINDTLPPPDPTGNAAYTAQFRHYRTLQAGGVVLATGLVVSLAANLWLAHRPPVVVVVRVDGFGQTTAERYSSFHYTPREAEIRARLNDWAIYRYRLVRAVAGEKFKQNYDYLSASLAQQLMQQDAPKVARILAGNEREQDVLIDNIQFSSLDNRSQMDGAVASGEAVINLTKIINPPGESERQHWTVTVRYEVDPVQAAKRGESEPQFQNLNPLGVTIIWFHEDRAFR
ncbi:MAG: hypothetical protein JOZ62_08460 [Acidobacteriaceae bacterium]|nr:hypothetical protein [Acidobacteriaceae bacterium]